MEITREIEGARIAFEDYIREKMGDTVRVVITNRQRFDIGCFEDTSEELITETCRLLNLDRDKFMSKSRGPIQYSQARQMLAIYFTERFPFTLTLCRTGRALNRNHATIIYYQTNHVNDYATAKGYKAKFTALCAKLDNIFMEIQ